MGGGGLMILMLQERLTQTVDREALDTKCLLIFQCIMYSGIGNMVGMKLPISFCLFAGRKKNPHFSVLKSVLNASRAIPVKLEPLIQLETHYANAKAWTDRAAKLLLKKNTTSLLEVSSLDVCMYSRIVDIFILLYILVPCTLTHTHKHPHRHVFHSCIAYASLYHAP